MMFFRLVYATVFLLVLPGVEAEPLLPPEPSTVAYPEGDVVHLEYGEHASCAIDSVTDLDNFTFDGSNGDWIRISLRSWTTMDPRIEIREPGNPVPIDNQVCNGGCTLTLNLHLTVSGNYTTSVSEWGTDHTGPYLIQLERIPPPSPPLSRKIPYDLPVNVSNNPSTDHDFITFNGAIDTLVRINVRSFTTLDPRLEVWDPSGAQIKNITCNGGCTLLEDITLEQSGMYLIGLSEWGKDHTGNVELSIQCLFGACPDDIDQDTVDDLTDNCFRVANTDQNDTDGDGFGNICDPDINNNGFTDAQDFATVKLCFDNFSSDPDCDLNGNGFTDAQDFAITKSHFDNAWPPGPSGTTDSCVVTE